MATVIDMVGRRYGHLEVIRFDSVQRRRRYYWWCHCDCGNELAIQGDQLRRGKAKSCRCMHGIRINTPITHPQLLKLLHYDADSGNWAWLVDTHRKKAGDQAGTSNKDHYWQVSLGATLYDFHVLAWFYMTGKWPEHEVDHINRDKSDNSWRNLRPATSGQNRANSGMFKNNTSGYKGVQLLKSGKYRAYFRGAHVGVYTTAVEAAKARDAVAVSVFGEYAFTNFS